MTRIADLVDLGILPIQHHDTSGKVWDDDFRLLLFGGRIRTTDDDRKEIEEETFGPVAGGFLWQTRDNEAWPRFWSFAAPARNASNLEVFPVSGPAWLDEERRSEAKRPEFPQEQRFPTGWSSIVLAGVNHTEQNDLAAPNFDGVVTQHWTLGELGTPWWDARTGALSRDRSSRTQSLARVVMPHKKCVDDTERPYLALQLGRAAGGFAGGFVADDFAGVTSRTSDGGPQAIASLSWRRGGFIHAGIKGGCQHAKGANDDKEVHGPAHLWTGAKFATSGCEFDAPLAFENEFYDRSARDWPFKTKVHLRPDPLTGHRDACGQYQGVWRWETSVPYTIIKEDPPPDGDPPPEGEGVPFEPSEGITWTPDWFEPRDPDAPPEDSPLYFRVGETYIKRELIGTSLELAAPAQAWIAQHYTCDGDIDLRNAVIQLDEDAEAQFRRRPVVMRSDAYGHEVGCDWSRASSHRGNRLRYLEADTAAGGVCDMPPELGMELAAGFRGTETYSDTYRVLWETTLAFATPDTSTGRVKSGWVNRLDGTSLDWGYVDGSGVESDVMSLRNSGILGISNSSGHEARLSPLSLTADRTHTLPDEAGTLPVREAMTAWFGDASDGDLTVDVGSSPVELEKDYFYDTLTIENGATLDTKGFRIYARALVMENGATIQNAGADASGKTEGAGADSGTLGGGKAGGPGGSGGSGGTAGAAADPGIGGAGGDASSGGVSGGAAIEPAERPRALPQAAHLRDSSGTAYAGGAGGAGGDDSGGSDGGGGGGGGGVIYIAARTIDLEAGAVIDASGGDGGTGAATADGGGGGGGGTVIAVYQTESGLSAAVDVSGGAAGAATAGGTAGSAGEDGELIQLRTA